MKGYWKSSIGAASVLLTIVYVLFFMQWGEDYHLASALEEFKEGKLQQSQKHLEQIGKSPELRHLGLAYVYRELYDLDNSDRQLQAALRWIEKNGADDLLEELSLNLALNYMLKNDSTSMSTPLADAKNKGGDSRPYCLLAAFAAQHLNEPKAAVKFFDAAPEKWSHSPWLRATFPRYLSNAWIAINKAEALISLDEFVLARQLLQNNVEDANREQIHRIDLLIGITHLKEGSELPFPASLPYYKLALSYFEKIDPLCFLPQLDPIKSQIADFAIKLIQNNGCTEFPFYAALLKKWQAKPQLDALSEAIEQEIDQAIRDKNVEELLEMSSCANCIANDPDLQKRIISALTSQMSQELKSGNKDKAENLWKVAQKLSQDPILLKDSLKSIAKEQILTSIDSDSAILTKSSPWIDLVDIIEKDAYKRFEFASFLIALSNSLWQKDRSEIQALEVLKRSQAFPYLTEKQRYMTQIEDHLKHLYRQNMGSNQVAKVPSIVEAIRYFDLKGVEFQNDTIIGNQYADAKYLAEQNRFDESLAKLRVVFLLNPSHPLGRELEGSIAFFQGNFYDAKNALDGIKNRTPEGNQIYGATLILTGAPDQGWALWKKTMESAPLNSKILERLGMELLLLGKGEDADRCLAKASQLSPPGTAARYYYAIQTKNWPLAHSLYTSLPASYQELPPMKLLMVQCLTGLGELKQAEDILDNQLTAANSPPQTDPSNSFPQYFLRFKEKILDPIDPNVTAAEFYLYAKNQPDKGLAFLIKSSPKDPHSLLLKGCALEKVGDFELAIETLKSLKSNREAFSALFRIYCSLKRYGHAYDLSQQMRPFSQDEETLFLTLLEETKRWKEIISYLSDRENNLDGYPCLLYAKAMMGQGKFFDTGAFIRDRLGDQFGSDPASINQYSLQLAELTTQLPEPMNLLPLWSRFSTNEAFDSLPQKDLEALFSLAIKAGNIELADRIDDHAKIHLEKSTRGQILISRLENSLGQQSKSIEALELAFNSDPAFRGLVRQLAQIPCSSATAEPLIAKFLKNLANPTDPYLQLLQIEARNALFMIKKNADELTIYQYHSELKELETLLNKIEAPTTKLADYHLLKGFIYKHQDRVQLARQEFEMVVKINALEPLAHVALSDLKLGKMPEEAIKHLELAVQLAPWRTDWRKGLIELYFTYNQPNLAARQISLALSYAPKDHTLLLQAAAIYRDRSAPAEAHATLLQAHKLAPKATEPLIELIKNLSTPDWARSDEEKSRLETERKWALEELQSLDPQAAHSLSPPPN